MLEQGSSSPTTDPRGALDEQGWRVRAGMPLREAELLLERTDEEIPFAETLREAADQFHLLRQHAGLRGDLFVLDRQFRLEHCDDVGLTAECGGRIRSPTPLFGGRFVGDFAAEQFVGNLPAEGDTLHAQ